MVGRFLPGFGHHGQVQPAADDLGDLPRRYALVGDAVIPGSAGPSLQRQPEEHGRIEIEALRLHMAEGLRVGWLFALADKQIGAAIGAMHDNSAHGWTLQTLAERAGMSRSTFALKFKATVGASPMDYLTRWRMLLAGDRLASSSDPVSSIALSLGYESESAFSTAFKRVMGCSPRQHGRGRAPASAPHGEEIIRLPEPAAG